jgi:hypothetical protein
MLVGLSVVGTLLAGGWWTAERRESIEGLEKSRVQLFGHKRNDMGVKVFGQMVA